MQWRSVLRGDTTGFGHALMTAGLMACPLKTPSSAGVAVTRVDMGSPIAVDGYDAGRGADRSAASPPRVVNPPGHLRPPPSRADGWRLSEIAPLCASANRYRYRRPAASTSIHSRSILEWSEPIQCWHIETEALFARRSDPPATTTRSHPWRKKK